MLIKIEIKLKIKEYLVELKKIKESLVEFKKINVIQRNLMGELNLKISLKTNYNYLRILFKILTHKLLGNISNLKQSSHKSFKNVKLFRMIIIF